MIRMQSMWVKYNPFNCRLRSLLEAQPDVNLLIYTAF